MKKLARAILQIIINDLPIQQREYGQAMLAELEETNGLQALVWASGGIQLWMQTRGGEIMKNATFWFGLIAVGILAGGLYVTRGLYWAIPVVVIGVITFAAFRPRDAMPVALLLGLSLPIADLLRVWFMLRSVIQPNSLSAISEELKLSAFSGEVTFVNPNPSMVLVPASPGSLKFEFLNVPDISRQLAVLNNSVSNLPQITIAILLGAIVIAGISAFIRSRVVARNMISQN
jgi:hypothetical protein